MTTQLPGAGRPRRNHCRRQIALSELVLLCPAWRNWGLASAVKPNTIILHSRQDDVIPFADSEELILSSGLPTGALVEVGQDHRLADEEPLKSMLAACERVQSEA
ncbi:MAG: hypothetical protein H6821_03905 [Planctomycetaceae bacterium]|nr:hypothetical protein [Planctomycetaceae bacterium]MCB9938696.1 hypothetical protein [Planctomycetaceae bacterium]